MKDYISKAMALSGQVRVYAAVTTNTVEKARNMHNMNHTPTVALGRVLTGIALMSQTLKGEDHSITVQIKGDGPIGGIVAVTDPKAGVRGYVHNPVFDLPLNDKGKFDIKGAVGNGHLYVIKDVGLKEPYSGAVELVSGEIAEDLTYYYAYSEQIPTAFNLGVLIGKDGTVEAAGGFFIQLLPGADEDTITKVENSIFSLEPITTLINKGKTPEDIIKMLFPDDSIEFFDSCPVEYKCTCSKERMERNLLSLGKNDLQEIAEDEKGAELHCHFCNTKYHFTKSELLTLLNIRD
ncbi:MAG: Hsp33 family molecular chaperone HslO [Clostridiaceae bacterium]|nr:Hsp33 family molecular chaperone HslO [Clostridiaceae bacterium]